jgi:hypothetical protein
MPGQKIIKGIKKLLMAKIAKIRFCPEEEAPGTAMADRLGRRGHLGCQKLPKRCLAGPPKCLNSQEDHRHYQE